MKFTPTDLESINCIRGLCIDAVEQANSGHPGMPLGTAPLAYVLWKHFLKFSSQNPNWLNRDRFILSAGHGSMLLFVARYRYYLNHFHLCGIQTLDLWQLLRASSLLL